MPLSAPLRGSTLGATILVGSLLVAIPAAAAAPAPQTVPAIRLPLPEVADVQADEARKRLYASGGDRLVAVDPSGQVTATLTGRAEAGALTLTPDGKTLYMGVNEGIVAIDPITLQVTRRYALNEDPVDVAFASGLVWYSGEQWSGIHALDPANGEVTDSTSGTNVIPYAGRLATVPGHDDWLLGVDQGLSPTSLYRFQISGKSLTRVVALSDTGGPPLALTPDGSKVITSGTGYNSNRTNVLGVAQLQTWPILRPSGTTMTPGRVAYSKDGDLAFAGQDSAHPNADIFIAKRGTTAVHRTFRMDRATNPYSGALTWLGDAVYRLDTVSGAAHIWVMPGAAKQATALTLSIARRSAPDVPVQLTGRLTFAGQAPGTAQRVSVSRTFNGRTQPLATISTKADGTFTYTHTGPGFGVMTYRVDFAGSATHSPAYQQATTKRRVPGDLNADGYAELPVGLPFRNVDGIADAGAYAVVPGSGTGAKGSAKFYTQNTPDIADVAEKDDAFGWAHASGDFNGDGYGDAVVSAPDENGLGAVNVLYGSRTGLTTTRNRTLRNGMPSFGFSVTTLDANNDGYDDIAVGATGRGAKSVVVYFGSAGGLYPENSMTVRPGVNGVPGTVYHWESFGFELRSGDFNGDGYDDLAVGDPYDWNNKYGTYGSVTVLYGRSGSGPSFRFRSPKRWDKDTSGVIGTVGHWVEGKDVPDYFGWSLGVGDFNNDGRDDLAIGSPGSTVWRSGTKYNDAGAINVLYGSGSGLTASGDQQFTLDSSGVPGTAKAEDYLGLAAAGGDVNGDGRAELAFSAETRQFVIVLRGGSRALTTTGARWITQNTSGVPGSTQSGGFFGTFLRFVHLRGANYTDLVVSAPGANSDRGVITVLPRGGTTGAYLVNIPASPGDWAGPLLAEAQPQRSPGQAKPPA